MDPPVTRDTYDISHFVRLDYGIPVHIKNHRQSAQMQILGVSPGQMLIRGFQTVQNLRTGSIDGYEITFHRKSGIHIRNGNFPGGNARVDLRRTYDSHIRMACIAVRIGEKISKIGLYPVQNPFLALGIVRNQLIFRFADYVVVIYGRDLRCYGRSIRFVRCFRHVA